MPEFNISKSKLEKGIDIIDLLYLNKIVSSKSEARRAIKGRGIKINNEIILNEKEMISTNNIKEDIIKFLWKKKHYLIKIN